MPTTEHLSRDIDETRRHIHQVLCHRENLEPDQFPISERVLQRQGQPCGILFCLHGPRQTRPLAVWERQRNVILFYDSTGQRFARTNLCDSVGTSA